MSAVANLNLMREAFEAAPHRLYGPIAGLVQDALAHAENVAGFARIPGAIKDGGTADRQIREGIALAKAVLATPPLGVSGEDRSEPTPAPREPRVWRHGVHKDIDQDVNEVAGTATGRRWKRMPDKQFVWMSSGCAYSAGTVLYVEDEVVEVVSPEGTP